MVAYLGVFGKCFVISVQNMRSALDDVDGNFVAHNARERMKQVLIEQIEQLSSEFDTSGTTTTDNERQQTPALLVGSSGQTSLFHIIQHLVLDPASIVNGLQEVAVLETLDTVWVCHAA
jgi:hypothetical protein